MPIEIVFHVFTHGRDERTESLAKALLYYMRFKKRSRCARLYIEVYTDRVNDVMMYENCLLSIGDYPS